MSAGTTEFWIFLVFLIIMTLPFLCSMFVLRKTRLQLEQSENDRRSLVTFLNRFAYNVSKIDNFDNAIIALARSIRNVAHCESLCIYFADNESKNLEPVTTIGPFPKIEEFCGTKSPFSDLKGMKSRRVQMGLGLIGGTAESQRSLLIHDAMTAPQMINGNKEQKIKSLMIVPIAMRGELQGLICTVNSNLGYGYEEDDLKMLESICGYASLTRNMIKAYTRFGEQQRLEQELSFARQIQSSLLPEETPQISNFSIYGYNRSAKEVSGDFYDYIEIDENRTLIVVADASGKGVPACMISTMTRSVLRSLSSNFTSLEEVVQKLNGKIFPDIETSRFITMAFCMIDKFKNTVELARAGHTDFLLKDSAGALQRITPAGPAIGLLPNMPGLEFETISFVMEPGASLFMYTDGLTEAINNRDEEFGDERLQKIFEETNKGCEATAKIILQKIEAFTGDMPQHDDQTLVIVSTSEA